MSLPKCYLDKVGMLFRSSTIQR